MQVGAQGTSTWHRDSLAFSHMKVFTHHKSTSHGRESPWCMCALMQVEKAKIALIQFCISPPKTDLENNVIISDYSQMDRVYKEERNYTLGLVKKIKASGCNVLLIQKSILRDATTGAWERGLRKGE
eukprot:scaffold115251_cov24-Tisochrysis_lutea.AAC.1